VHKVLLLQQITHF